MRLRLRRSALASVLALSATLTPSLAGADDGMRFSVDWDKLGIVLHEGTTSLLPREAWHPDAVEARTTPESFLGTSPHLALVARDWGVSQVLWGNLAVTDQFRLSRSSRMVVTRVRLAEGRLMPFVHVGVGQWRADTSVVPLLQSDTQLASQMGGGFELQIAPRVVLALEADCTMLYREGHEAAPAAVASGELWSTLLAARARF
ncbi:MAG: hypothetical protein ABSE49_07565 [Polyangiaceae bacterium]